MNDMTKHYDAVVSEQLLIGREFKNIAALHVAEQVCKLLEMRLRK